MASSELNESSLELLEELYGVSKDETQKIDFILSKFRVLTREKALNEEVLSQKCIETLIDHSKQCHLEAQKCLSNLILNYTSIREKLTEPYTKCVESRLNDINQSQKLTGDLSFKEQFHEVLYYDLRIIFLLSALCPNSRNTINQSLLDPLLEFTSRGADEFSKDNYLVILEAIKTLFNLTLSDLPYKPLMVDVIKKLFSIVGTEKDVTNDENFVPTDKPDSERLLVNVIHLLTNMPEEVYKTLSDQDVDKVLNHLDNQLKTFSKQNLRETVLPVMNVCANICKYNEQVRLRWFQEIIESSKEFDKRPEEYETFRGRLVKLMTSVDIHIKDIAAEFVYNLCGRNTEKFITYTGLGNSAAFLTSRGLLAGHSRQQGNEDPEFQQLRDRLNPITGRVEEIHENPMDKMSEEEKEYHAHQLASAITRLNNLGVVKPMQLDEDGQISDLRPDAKQQQADRKTDS